MSLTAHQGVQGDDAEQPGIFGFAHVGIGKGFLGPHFLVGKDNVNGIAGFGAYTIEKDVHPGNVTVYKTGGFEGDPGGVEILTAYKHVHVLRIADGGFVNAGDPQGHGVAAGDGIGDVGGPEGGGGPQKTLAHFFHGVDHPF